MSSRNRVILLFGLLLAGFATLLAFVPDPERPIGISLAKLVDSKEGRLVILELVRRTPQVYWTGNIQIQARLKGHWQPRLALPQVSGDFQWGRTNRQQLKLLFPSGTQACRVTLGYRVGARRYCRVYGYLYRSGIRARFPRLSKIILEGVRVVPDIRNFRCDLALPS